MINLTTKDWQLDNIDTVLFDKDGTFIDLHYFWGKMTELRAKEIIEQYNLNKSHFEQICSYLGYDINKEKMLSNGITALYSRVKIIEIFKNNLKELGVITDEEKLTQIFDFVSEKFYKNINEYTKPIESALEFINELHSKGIKLGIVTSDSIISTKLTLKHFGWEHLFNVTIGRESSIHTKESGEPTKLALKELNANPNKTIMIGDAPIDYISAEKAQIKATILVATGQINKEELRKTSKYVVSSLNEIKII